MEKGRSHKRQRRHKNESMCYYGPVRPARRMDMSDNNGGAADKFLFFMAGAGIGAVLALLFAPKSGRETREIIARTATDGRDFLSNKVNEGKQMVEEKGRRFGDDFNTFLDKSK